MFQIVNWPRCSCSVAGNSEILRNFDENAITGVPGQRYCGINGYLQLCVRPLRLLIAQPRYASVEVPSLSLTEKKVLCKEQDLWKI